MPINTKQPSLDLSLRPIDNERLQQLCGPCDEHLRLLENYLAIQLQHRGHEFRILGEITAAQQAYDILQALYVATTESEMTAAKVHLMTQTHLANTPSVAAETSNTVLLRLRHGVVKPRGAHQQAYVDRIAQHIINFALGPAGTGKTYLAVAAAVAALQAEQVQRIILVRPVVEAGERLGFLPGDLTQKVDPYFRPLYDALYEMLGADLVQRYIDQHVIEVAPLAYMRGRTLNEAFIILDESQNTTTEQMKMFLTRIGFGSHVVITGDLTQIDLPKGQTSGLRQALAVLRQVPGISFTEFDAADIVRHPLVQAVVQAYETHEAQRG